MRVRKAYWVGLVAVVTMLLAAGCGGSKSEGDNGSEASGPKDKVTLQLKWVTQAQFAGYYAAKEQGYYDDDGLDVTLKVGGPDITPEQVVTSGGAQFGIDWLPALLAARDKGGDIVNIAQVFTRSGMTELTHKDSGISDIAGMKGKKVGVWCCGNENELFAALRKNSIDPKDSSQVKIVNQPFDMNLFVSKQVDAAAAMTYNELAQVLETKNPDTGKPFQLSDLNVIKLEDVGTGMLEDGVFVRGDWIKDAKNQEIARRFLEASFKGWIYCRDNPDKCVQTVLDNGPTLGEGHQTWQMNEINALIWPAPDGIGIMNTAAYNRTADIAQQFGVISKAPAKEAYRTDIAMAALDELEGKNVDVNGSDWQKETVEVTPGGK